MKYLSLLISPALAGFTAWIFWGPVREFCFSLIPQTAEYAWAGKLAVLVLIGYLGGIALPLFVLIVSFFVIATALGIKS